MWHIIPTIVRHIYTDPIPDTDIEIEFRFGQGHWHTGIWTLLSTNILGNRVQEWRRSIWLQSRKHDTIRRRFFVEQNHSVQYLPSQVVAVGQHLRQRLRDQTDWVSAIETCKRSITRIETGVDQSVMVLCISKETSHAIPVPNEPPHTRFPTDSCAVRYSGRTRAGELDITAWFENSSKLLPSKVYLEFEVHHIQLLSQELPWLYSIAKEVYYHSIWLSVLQMDCTRHRVTCDIFQLRRNYRGCEWSAKTDGVRALCVTNLIRAIDTPPSSPHSSRSMDVLFIYHPCGMLVHDATPNIQWTKCWKNLGCVGSDTDSGLWTQDILSLCSQRSLEKATSEWTVLDGEWLPSQNQFYAFDVLAVTGALVQTAVSFHTKMRFLELISSPPCFIPKPFFENIQDACIFAEKTPPCDGLIMVDSQQRHYKLKDLQHATIDVVLAPLSSEHTDTFMLMALHENRQTLVPVDTWTRTFTAPFLEPYIIYEFNIHTRTLVRPRHWKGLPNKRAIVEQVNRTHRMQDYLCAIFASHRTWNIPCDGLNNPFSEPWLTSVGSDQNT